MYGYIRILIDQMWLELFLVHKVDTTKIKTKEILKWVNKYYANDTWVRNIYGWNYDIEKILENYIYIELLRRWYKVQIVQRTN